MRIELQQSNLNNTQEVTSCFAASSVRYMRMELMCFSFIVGCLADFDYVLLHCEVRVKDKP